MRKKKFCCFFWINELIFHELKKGFAVFSEFFIDQGHIQLIKTDSKDI